jgi:apolipoprotein D and lipocalin family protein
MAVSGAMAASAQKPTPGKAFDLNHMRGTWYEIARYPGKAQRDCARNDFQLIAFGDGRNTVTFVDSCTGKHGDMDMKSSRATQVKSGEAKLKTRRWLIFSKSYLVLGAGQDDAWMVLANANHKELWVLSKTRELAPDALAEAEAKATAAGYSTAKLIMVPQDPPPTA